MKLYSETGLTHPTPSHSPPTPATHDRTKSTRAKDIAHAFTRYYEPLFARKSTDPQAVATALDTLSEPNSNRVQIPTARKCDAQISGDEILATCAHLPLGKSPGPDRIPNKFYKVFSAVLAPILEKVFEESRQRGNLPQTLRQGIISVMYKKTIEITHATNRP